MLQWVICAPYTVYCPWSEGDFCKHKCRTSNLCLIYLLIIFTVQQVISVHISARLMLWGYLLTKTFQNGGPLAISEILHIEYQIVCCIETYLIHIYHMRKCKKWNWNRCIEGFFMWNVHFHINGLSPNIAYVNLMSWPLMEIYFLLLNYWLFSVQFSYHI